MIFDRIIACLPAAVASFRCTCNRAGQSHSFGSMDVARTVGGTVQDRFGWRVQMKDSDIEVVVNVTDGESGLRAGACLTNCPVTG